MVAAAVACVTFDLVENTDVDGIETMSVGR